MKNKIGVGIITRNREIFFQKCLSSIPQVDELIVVNDGAKYSSTSYSAEVSKIIQHRINNGISLSKNDCFKYLMGKNCKHIFILEDDIRISDPHIFENYIRAAEVSKIKHFNYGFHGPWNKVNGKISFRKKIDYNENVSLIFNQYLTGAFSYYQKEVLEKIGLMDIFYRNILEHVDHTYRIIKAGFHPPFFWFADVFDSAKMIEELDEDLQNSILRKNKNLFDIKVRLFNKYFKFKFGTIPGQVNHTSEKDFMRILKKDFNLREK